MKIGMIVGHPTQFEGPFFRYVARDPEHLFRVIYTDPERMKNIKDHELTEEVSWGMDLLSGYDYVVLPGRGWVSWLLEEIKREKFDLLIINGYSKRVYIAAALLAKWHGTPTALRLDSVLFNNTSRLKLSLKKVVLAIVFNFYSHFFAIGSLTLEYLKYFNVMLSKISIFSYAVDVDYFRVQSTMDIDAWRSLRSHYGLPDTGIVILSVAKFSKRESPWDLLRAFPKIKGDNLWLLLVGDGEERRDLEALAGSLACDNIRFAGYVKYPFLPSIYGIADIFVHPAHDEPWGVSVAEAMACGLPVIASSRVGSAADLIRAGKNGYIYEFGNPDDLGDKIVKVMSLMGNKKFNVENDEILSGWNYERTWQNIKNATVAMKL